MCDVCPIFRDFRQFHLIVTLKSEVLIPSNLQLYVGTYTSSVVLTRRYYKVGI